MADFWIKIEKGTPDKPEILELAALLDIEDPDTITGKMIRVWSWFDSNSENGHAPIVTKVLLDRLTGVTGLTDGLVTVGWLEKTEEGYSVPNFERHLGKGAKKRASDAERKRKSRDNSQQKRKSHDNSQKSHNESVTEKGLDKSRVDKSRVDKSRVDKSRVDNKEVVTTSSPAKAGNDVLEIFGYWKEVMKKGGTTRLNKKREKLISDRLKEGYQVDEFKAAIFNCSMSPFHMGQNDNRTKYNDIELICRPDKFEQFRDNVGQQAQPRQMSKATERTVNNIIDVELD